MCGKLFPVLVVCLAAVVSASGQKVLESDSSVALNDRFAIASLVVEGNDAARNVAASVEMVDPSGTVISRANKNKVSLTGGKQTVEFRLPADSEKAASGSEDITWCRLRYRIGDASGTIAMSQLIRDLFELRVIASDNLLAGMTYRVRVRAVNPFTGRPASGVNAAVTVELDISNDDKNKLKLEDTAVTDADGFAVVSFAIPPETKLDGDGEIAVRGRKNGIFREVEEDLNALREDVQLLLMTDKPIYQPEQMLHVRGILMKGGEAKVVLANSEVEFRIADEDRTVLYREKVVSSAFGIASISWRIPANAKLGDYRIEVRDESGDQIGGSRVRVTRYDLPNFVVEAKAAKSYYLPGENEAEVTVKADYLFGKPVTKGKVRVVEEKQREWNWKEQKYDVNEGQVREGETDAGGKFIAKFDLKEDHEDIEDDDWRKYRDIKFAAYFTDPTTNKTEQRRFDIRVTREPIHVYLIGETDNLNPELPINAYVSTFYADGTAAECDVDIKASVEDEDEFKAVGSVRTNSFGAGRISMRRPKIGDADDDLDLRLTAKDKQGRRGTFVGPISFDEDPRIQIATDRAIYKPGETMTVRINSSLKSGTVYADVVAGWSVIDSRFAELKNGKAEIRIPYSEMFKGELKVAAFVEDEGDDDEIVRASRGVIFPTRQGINIDANFDKTIYKPNEEATLSLGIVDAVGQAIESALGIVVIDKAVEERARTDADFGNRWGDFAGWLGYGGGFGSVNVKTLNEMDLTKPISDEMQLVAEVILYDNYYSPNIFRSKSYYTEAPSVFGSVVSRQFQPVEAALNGTFRTRDYLHPTNEAGLKNILGEHGIDFAEMRDPWNMAYRAEFSVNKSRNVLTVLSAGPDKQFATRDDFTAFTIGFEYFTPMGRAVDTAVRNYHARTGSFIRDDKTLFAQLGVRELLDRFGRPYKLISDADGRFLKLRLRSAGADGKFEAYEWAGDDFDVWTSRIDYFESAEKKIAASQRAVKSIPLTESEFRASVKIAGIDLGDLRDGFGNPLHIVALKRVRYWDKITFESVRNHGETTTTERRKITPVTQEIIEFTIRSSGRDGKPGTYDDFTLTQVVHVLSEQTKDDPKPVPVTQPVSYPASTGSIAGVVTDANGAAIANATVTATNSTSGVSRTTNTSDSGSYLIAVLPAGTYALTVEAAGFLKYVVSSIPVKANETAQADATLRAGTVSEVVTVSADAESVLQTTNSSLASVQSRQIASLPLNTRNALDLVRLRPGAVAATEQEKSTPRLREYFPETLLWQPEVLTDKDGKAQVKFRMADNITTWKMYTIASTKNGKIGVAEKDVTAFQAFFVDLDPPKFLTEGDEIFLPSQVRNYTGKKQKVEVTLAKAEWFAPLNAEKQAIDVAAGETQNAVFGFRAAMPVKDGKQRITAIAEMDSDAIEKPVTVRPNGQEVVRTETKYFTGREKFDIAFPENALPRTQKAELKIYPNLLSHVAESVDGLLQRPYGCGEQTISSTYPNLMILKFGKPGSAIAAKARKYLQKGYERLVGYQAADGGFTYWGGKNASDIALTAYALRFLNDAKSQLEVDEAVIKRAEDWLLKQQRADGSWTTKYYYDTAENTQRTKLITTYVARSIAMRKDTDKAASAKAFAYLKARNAEIDEPYAMALFGLALLDAGDSEGASQIAKRLETMAIAEGNAAFWKLETNTPFYGWGTAGRVETTALVLQLLIREAALRENKTAERDALIGKATLFLLKNKDRYGVWYSTQTTINVLDAFLATLGTAKANGPQRIEIIVNGETMDTIDIAPDQIEVILRDLSGKLNAAGNAIEVRGSNGAPLMSQIVASHYIDWKDADTSDRNVNASRALQLDYKCDKSNAAIMEEVTCSVKAERIGHRGYGMLLAEIGTPPGADVSRESLEKAIEADWSVSRYDVLPDRIVVYMWSKAGGTNFNFKFRPRYGINAQTPASVVYDYYNPEAQAVAGPKRFIVK